ncbi:MAG: signal peptidase I [Candidatus Zixiibacteriota bacterium]
MTPESATAVQKGAGKTRPRRPATTGDYLWENTKTILIAFVMAIVIKTSLVEAYKIPSASMEDTLLVGDFLLANKVVYGARLPFVGWQLPSISEPKSGDVFIFLFPGEDAKNYIKRCVAGPGQVVQVIDKVLYVDGKRFPDPEFSKFTNPFVKPNLRPHPNGEDWRSGPSGQPDNFGPYTVRAGHFFAMGDNRDNSWDSRFWGPVPRENILGKAMMIHWSWRPDDGAPLVTINDPLSVPQLFLYNALHFIERVRWGRLFTTID